MPQHPISPPPSDDEQSPLLVLADQYLDFWQNNITAWATDPDMLNRWVNELATAQYTPQHQTDDGNGDGSHSDQNNQNPEVKKTDGSRKNEGN
ncbi:MAG: hypothetical protein CMF31_04355 [Kordiimonas sp.]|nr:hypothetical protein [Kordiimonas sp.]|tara:strand:- start:692 stop:970 length:279 start_codon:yes stop_codon:yes gene_type:complete